MLKLGKQHMVTIQSPTVLPQEWALDENARVRAPTRSLDGRTYSARAGTAMLGSLTSSVFGGLSFAFEMGGLTAGQASLKILIFLPPPPRSGMIGVPHQAPLDQLVNDNVPSANAPVHPPPPRISKEYKKGTKLCWIKCSRCCLPSVCEVLGSVPSTR